MCGGGGCFVCLLLFFTVAETYSSFSFFLENSERGVLCVCVLLCMVTTFRVGYTCMPVLLTDIISTTGSQKDETKISFFR